MYTGTTNIGMSQKVLHKNIEFVQNNQSQLVLKLFKSAVYTRLEYNFPSQFKRQSFLKEVW